MQDFKTIGVMGAGAWGSALANACAIAGRRVILWGRDAQQMQHIAQHRTNPKYLDAIPVEAGVKATSHSADLCEADAILVVIPTQAMRSALPEALQHIAENTPLISCAKGIERGSLVFPTAVLKSLCANPVGVLSGPSFAVDVAQGLPTAVTLAMRKAALAERIAQSIGSPTFRPYHTTDVLGVELGGAAKNVLAIAAGIATGKGLGASAVAALIARGFAEVRALGEALGARPETLMGLSGLGDLVLTATSPQSRNYALGFALGSGQPRPEKLSEGAFTAEALVALAAQHSVDMPIAKAVDAVLRGAAIEDVVQALLARDFKAEM